ncbi:uncharacterized protein LOC128983222 [Macrosteles quadrilineatus]|uniref:uncharacterized protein LOC128983222 n=1 Tax=Macrosteles quadrilineatus TaxID=74068 RepID=UPI0023E22C1E|nr:uncharacterized protein LOC128983222 [Macrosteles quadrilineatus]
MAYSPRKYTKKEARNDNNKNKPNDLGTSKLTGLMRAGSIDSSKPLQDTQAILAERDLRLGRATWNKYVLPMQDFGTSLFKELFQTYPQYESIFAYMIKSQNRDLFSCTQFKMLSSQRVMTKLKGMMDSLDKHDELLDMMTKLGLYHAKLGVTRQHMESMQRAIVNTVRLAMNKQMQGDEEESLNKCLTFAFRIAIAAGEEYLQSQAPTTNCPGQTV